uniref:Xyloglucan endotransglucosylase/hydrolase n=1 Tax=Nicotiana sylvestris TaxID=4096 RepID=A0A1U7WBU2_NICSY|nr:PREDICTED: probable xyloglucan endotransglucosylase/hydrolase protein 27 [Nicotiana sylvestris]
MKLPVFVHPHVLVEALIIFCLICVFYAFCCSFYVDNIPIREIKRTKAMGGDFPSKPMSLYATIWDGSSWATNGGKYKVNYKYSPYVAKFSDFVLHGCAVDPIELSPKCDTAPKSAFIPTSISPDQRRKMESFRKKYLQYSYCYDRTRYNVPLSECVIDPKEADHLQGFDPVTFGGFQRHHSKRRHQRQSRREDTSSEYKEGY